MFHYPAPIPQPVPRPSPLLPPDASWTPEPDVLFLWAAHISAGRDARRGRPDFLHSESTAAPRTGAAVEEAEGLSSLGRVRRAWPCQGRRSGSYAVDCITSVMGTRAVCEERSSRHAEPPLPRRIERSRVVCPLRITPAAALGRPASSSAPQGSESIAINASGARKRPRRNAGGITASMAASFSEGSMRR